MSIEQDIFSLFLFHYCTSVNCFPKIIVISCPPFTLDDLNHRKLCNKELDKEAANRDFEYVDHHHNVLQMEVNSKKSDIDHDGEDSKKTVIGGLKIGENTELKNELIQESENRLISMLSEKKSNISRIDSYVGLEVWNRPGNSQRFSLPDPNLPKLLDKEQFKNAHTTSLPVLKKYFSCSISDQSFPSKNDESEENADNITAQSPSIALEPKWNMHRSSSSLNLNTRSKSGTFQCIVRLAGITFLTLTILLVAVLFSIPSQHQRYHKTSESENPSKFYEPFNPLSDISTKFRAPATDLQLNKEQSENSNTKNVFKYSNGDRK